MTYVKLYCNIVLTEKGMDIMIKKIFKRTMVLIAVIVFIGTVNISAADNNHISVYVNDFILDSDVNAQIINSRTMVPMRAIFEALGAEVNWNEANQTAVGTKDGVTVSLTIGSRTMYVGDSTVKLDSPPVIVSDRTLMPVRAVSEAFGFEVQWDEPTKSAYIGSHSRIDSLKRQVEEMGIGDKIYQMMIVTPESITGVEKATEAGEATKGAIEKYPVGGLIYFSKNIVSENQIKNMINNSQSYSKIPLFISVDEEGGRVARLGNADIGFPIIPSMKEIGDSNDIGKASEIGETLGTALKEYGFNLNFAPDSDVVINSASSIGDRSFGSDPQLVGRMVSAEIRAMQSKGVSSCMKHFPGLGSAEGDTHNGFVATDRSLEEMNSCEFIPFSYGAAADCDFVMVGHISARKITENGVPSSMSSRVIAMLRNDIGFSGVVITDALNMGAIIKTYTTSEACVAAVSAGADILLMPSDINEAHFALANAVAEGILSEERINYSVMRILDKKMSRGLINY